MNIVRDYLKNDEYYKRMNTENINDILEEIENYITQRLNIRYLINFYILYKTKLFPS